MIPAPFRRRPSRAAGSGRGLRLAVLGAAVALYTVILYPSFLASRPVYLAGDVARKDIKAPKDFLVEDLAATEARRQQAALEAPTVYDIDPQLGARLAAAVDEAFAGARAMLAAAVEARAPEPAAAPRSASEEIQRLFEERLGLRVGRTAWGLLVSEAFPRGIAETIGEILQRVMEKGVISGRDALPKDLDKGIVLRDVRTKEERLVRDFRQFIGIDQAKSLAQGLGQSVGRDLDAAHANLVIDLAQRLIQANITLNRNETEERRQRAAAEVKPVLYKIKAGEMILREGERVSDQHLVKLRALDSDAARHPELGGVAGAAVLMLVLMAVTHRLFLSRRPGRTGSPGRDVVLMAAVFVLFMLLLRALTAVAGLVIPNLPWPVPPAAAVFLAPLAAAPMIAAVFLRLSAALPFAVVTAVAAGAVADNSLPLAAHFLIVGSMGAYWVRDCRLRRVFITAGVKTGLLGALLAAAIGLNAAGAAWDQLLWTAAFAFLGGVGSGLAAAALVPLAELGFGYTTDITLLELANLDRPILRRLMIEAPGTYHHSVIVGALAEAAALEIDANPLIAKVSGYFHDIGKIRKPLYFIENQRNGKNRHDKLAPSLSNLILAAHIKDGVEIAREHRLGRMIVEAIAQHHGTSLMRYFFEKAKQLKGAEAVKEADFRYPGPKPQTPEAALVMLADVVEAASRTLENPTPARIKALVTELVGGVLADGQLDECDVTLREIHKITASFVAILNGIHHQRIEYLDPRPPSKAGKEEPRDGDSDRQPPAPPPGRPETDRDDRPDRPRRLKAS
jgi:hypothetical protein